MSGLLVIPSSMRFCVNVTGEGVPVWSWKVW
jgi:hypothetical protein